MSPRPYRMAVRQAATDKNRQRMLVAARSVLLVEDFSQFSMEAVARKAGVTRLTVYNQFESRSGLLEALYDYIARRGEMERLADLFRPGGDPLRTLYDFIVIFARFWDSDRDLIRRLHALGAIDSEIGKGLRARNERRRNGLAVIVDRYCRLYLPLTSLQLPVAIDTLHLLTSFESFDALKGTTRTREEVVGIIEKLAWRAIGFTPRFAPSSSN